MATAHALSTESTVLLELPLHVCTLICNLAAKDLIMTDAHVFFFFVVHSAAVKYRANAVFTDIGLLETQFCIVLSKCCTLQPVNMGVGF